MKLTKTILRQLILEEYEKIISEQEPIVGNQPTQPSQQNQKQMMKQNISQQIRIIRFMKETLKQVKLPQELENMVAQAKKSKTSSFLTDFLQVPKTIPIQLASVLEHPMELLQTLVDEVLKMATQKANQKLAEEKLPDLIKDDDYRLAKHKKKNAN